MLGQLLRPWSVDCTNFFVFSSKLRSNFYHPAYKVSDSWEIFDKKTDFLWESEKKNNKTTIRLYNDKGVGKIFFKILKLELKTVLDLNQVQITEISADEMKNSTEWIKNSDLLVMPGGIDSSYNSSLGTQGRSNIRKFVNDMGKNYFGLCAGAYFASRFVEFNKNRERSPETDEVVCERDLNFFPGVAWGPVHYGFSYSTDIGCKVSQLRLSNSGSLVNVLCNGGCSFLNDSSDKNTKVLASYTKVFVNEFETKENAPAIIQTTNQNSGGIVVLSGPHPEFNPIFLEPLHPTPEIQTEFPFQRSLYNFQENNKKRRELFKNLLIDLRIPKKCFKFQENDLDVIEKL